MGDAKGLLVRPVSASEASALVRRVHYSGKVVNNSQVHLGVFWNGRLEGAMQLGPPMVKRQVLPLVEGTAWNQMIELNRMAFSEALPRNSESRAMGVLFRLLRRLAPSVKWVLSFADGTQCGDGTIYRASGFALTGIKRNDTIVEMPGGQRLTGLALSAHWDSAQVARICRQLGVPHQPRSVKEWEALGATRLKGYQLRYIRFLDPTWAERLTVPVIPFDRIPDDARMYRGDKRRPEGGSGDQPGTGGASPTSPLHPPAEP